MAPDQVVEGRRKQFTRLGLHERRGEEDRVPQDLRDKNRARPSGLVRDDGTVEVLSGAHTAQHHLERLRTLVQLHQEHNHAGPTPGSTRASAVTAGAPPGAVALPALGVGGRPSALDRTLRPHPYGSGLRSAVPRVCRRFLRLPLRQEVSMETIDVSGEYSIGEVTVTVEGVPITKGTEGGPFVGIGQNGTHDRPTTGSDGSMTWSRINDPQRPLSLTLLRSSPSNAVLRQMQHRARVAVRVVRKQNGEVNLTSTGA